MPRLRHCLECPNCKTRYLISLSPFKNGSYVVTVTYGSCEEYILHCSCGKVGSRWTRTGVVICQVSRAAYERGYGPKEEIVPVSEEPRDGWSFATCSEPKNWKLAERRKYSL